MKKSEIMFHAAQAAEALDAQQIAGSTAGACHYGGMCRMIISMGGHVRFENGKHAVSLFGFPYATADDKVVQV